MYILSILHSGCSSSSFLAVEPINSNTKCSFCKQIVRYNDPQWSINRLPCPILISQLKSAGCVVIKPSNGVFMSYKLGDDLHIGISDSSGSVHSFWFQGIEVQNSTWHESLILVDLTPFFLETSESLDSCLESFENSHRENFHGSKYQDETWNCFDFVMEFLKYIDFRNYTKTEFAEEFTTGKLQRVVKYFTLFEKLRLENLK